MSGSEKEHHHDRHGHDHEHDDAENGADATRPRRAESASVSEARRHARVCLLYRSRPNLHHCADWTTDFVQSSRNRLRRALS